jgi:hypothetical protein
MKEEIIHSYENAARQKKMKGAKTPNAKNNFIRAGDGELSPKKFGPFFAERMSREFLQRSSTAANH